MRLARRRSSDRSIVSSARSIGSGFGDIRRFLVTHIHRDHYTQAVALRRVGARGTAVGIGFDDMLAGATNHATFHATESSTPYP